MTITYTGFRPMNPRPKTPEERVRELEQQVKAYEERFRILSAEPQRFALVIGIDGSRATLRGDAGIVSVEVPPGCNVKLGDTLRVTLQPLAIVDIVSPPVQSGTIVEVRAVLDEDWCEVMNGAEPRVVRSAGHELAEGDRVVLDPVGLLVSRKLPAPKAPVHVQDEADQVSWDDIGGCEEAKAALIEAIELPYEHRDIFERYGQKPVRGVLLSGPAGCGKTLLGRAVATSLARSRGEAARATGFIYQKGPEILSKFVGESERGVRDLFAAARAHKEKHGYPAVIFLDEADAILGNRLSNRFTNVERTVVPQFLSEMDGLDESAAFVLLATNRPESLDPAIVRDRRIDRRVRVTRPDRKVASDIMTINLRGKPRKAFSTDKVLELLFDDRWKLLEVDRRVGEPVRVTLGHTVSGAMIADLVNRAVQRAIHRDIAKEGEPGIEFGDFERAIEARYREAFDVDHSEVVLELVNQSEIAAVRKVMPR